MTSLSKKIVKIHEYYTTQHTADSNVYKHAASYVTPYPTSMPLAAECCKLGHGRRLRCAFASPNPSAVVANSCTHRRRRRDATKQFRLVVVGGVYWALSYYARAALRCQKIRIRSNPTLLSVPLCSKYAYTSYTRPVVGGNSCNWR